eukprot:11874281-Karenia_brevis.AAC.1
MNVKCCNVYNTDFCQHGTRWRKRTKVATWHLGLISDFDKQCSGRNGFCSKTKKQHIILSGQSKEHGVLWTKIAQAYPTAFARSAAKSFEQSIEQSQLNRLHQLFLDGCNVRS